jgi:non-homologous end joining protein Ku
LLRKNKIERQRTRVKKVGKVVEISKFAQKKSLAPFYFSNDTFIVPQDF